MLSNPRTETQPHPLWKVSSVLVGAWLLSACSASETDMVPVVNANSSVPSVNSPTTSAEVMSASAPQLPSPESAVTPPEAPAEMQAANPVSAAPPEPVVPAEVAPSAIPAEAEGPNASAEAPTPAAPTDPDPNSSAVAPAPAPPVPAAPTEPPIEESPVEEPPAPDFSNVGPPAPPPPPVRQPTINIPVPVAPPAPRANNNADDPSELLNLSRWRLELPTGRDGNIDRLDPDELDGYSKAPFFRLNTDQTGVIFRAHAGGATTGNSGFPRSELREMKDDEDEADWSVNSKRTMTIIQRVVELTPNKPHVVVGQIHDDEDDVVMVRLEGQRLFVQSRGITLGTLEDRYLLGEWFKIRIIVDDGAITVEYNDTITVEMPDNLARCDGGCYFKAGCYTQSNEEFDDDDEFAEVHIAELTVSRD